MTRRIAPVVLAASTLLASTWGCGGSTAAMTATAAGQLAAADRAVHLAVAGGDRAAAEEAIASLRRTVATLRDRRQLSTDRADAILAAAETIHTDLVLMPTTTTTTTTPPSRHPRDNQDGGGGD